MIKAVMIPTRSPSHQPMAPPTDPPTNASSFVTASSTESIARAPVPLPLEPVHFRNNRIRRPAEAYPFRHMPRQPQWQVAIEIAAPVSRVWSATEDLSLIPSYHPIVRQVEFVSGSTKRAPGVNYKCVVPRGPGKGWCIERVVESIPNQRMTVSIPEDSWG